MYVEGGRGAGGGSEEPRYFRTQILCACHSCGKQDDQDAVRKTWLTPIFVSQGDRAYLQTQLCPACAKWRLLYWIKVVWKLRIGRISNVLAPGFGACGCCHTNWHFIDGHSTDIAGTGIGMFPMCEQCWAEHTPEQRLPFYKRSFERWGPRDDMTWDDVETSVLEETLHAGETS